MTDHLLEVEALQVVYHVGGRPLTALHNLSLYVRPGEIVGVVGESGSGKSTLGAAVLRLLPPNGEVISGSIRFKGRDLLSMSPHELRNVRGPGIATIFQDPLTSLNPTLAIRTQMVDVLQAHQDTRRLSGRQMLDRVVAALEEVGMPDARERVHYFPHQFSGGMRQRIMIAMALMLHPSLLIADEPTSSLDVTLEVQILELLRRLRREHAAGILFISHDLGVIAQLCDRVVVMYAGRAVEDAEIGSLFERPLHPYTHALMASVPSVRNRGQRLATVPGRVPSLSDLPPGCTFAPRCPYAQRVCDEREPDYLVLSRSVRCYIYDPDSGYDADDGRLDALGRWRSPT